MRTSLAIPSIRLGRRARGRVDAWAPPVRAEVKKIVIDREGVAGF